MDTHSGLGPLNWRLVAEPQWDALNVDTIEQNKAPHQNRPQRWNRVVLGKLPQQMRSLQVIFQLGSERTFVNFLYPLR